MMIATVERARRVVHQLEQFGDPGTPILLSGRGELPVTYAFVTSSGSRGVLQIVEFVADDETKVRSAWIRYRMVVPAPAPENEQ